MDSMHQAMRLVILGWVKLDNDQLKIDCRSEIGTPVKQNIVCLWHCGVVCKIILKYILYHKCNLTSPTFLLISKCLRQAQIQPLHTSLLSTRTNKLEFTLVVIPGAKQKIVSQLLSEQDTTAVPGDRGGALICNILQFGYQEWKRIG